MQGDHGSIASSALRLAAKRKARPRHPRRDDAPDRLPARCRDLRDRERLGTGEHVLHPRQAGEHGSAMGQKHGTLDTVLGHHDDVVGTRRKREHGRAGTKPTAVDEDVAIEPAHGLTG